MKAEKSDFEIVKNRMKNDFNSKTPQEQNGLFKKIYQKENDKNKKLKLVNRPHSNYLPKYKKHCKTKTSKLNNLIAIGFIKKPKKLQIYNKKFYMIEKKINTNATLINKNSNEINLINGFKSQKALNAKQQRQRNMDNQMLSEFHFTSPIKRNTSNLTYAKTTKIKNINSNINKLSPKKKKCFFK